MNVLIPGGAGYIGALLVPQLLAVGHKVTVYDAMFFGNGHLPSDNENLRIIKADVRDVGAFRQACMGQEAVIYLASISNNDMCRAHTTVARDINITALRPNMEAAATEGVKRFIYASSVAGYMREEATENEPLAPLTEYANAKALCELHVMQQKDMCCVVTRSASVCGYSPHQRLDLTVNMMVHHGVRNGMVRIAGGEQKRSHVHIQDICDFYKLLLDAPDEHICGQIFNVVAESQTVRETAYLVAQTVGAAVITAPRTDDRSYTASGEKAKQMLDWTPKKTVWDAIRDLEIKFESGYWPDSLTNPVYLNMRDTIV